MVQIGDEKEDGEKPAFASLRSDQSINSISLEQALDLFKLPRTLGEFEDLVVKANVGRFGPYIQHGKAFVSIKKEDDPMTITLERAIELVEQKRIDDQNKILKTFTENTDIQILNGRWGAYIKVGKDNFKIPKGTEWESLELADCLKLIEEQKGQPKKSFRKSTKK
jgi:DNA topoisomerase-1